MESRAADPKTQDRFPGFSPGWIVCCCVNCKRVLCARVVAMVVSVVTCDCGAEIDIPIGEGFSRTYGDQTAERLFADDESVKERILAIDLSIYDELVTYPAGSDWPLERKKILFLQTALRLRIPWADVVQCTTPYFGTTLCSPPMPVVPLSKVPPFTPPAFDIARQTPDQWGASADKAWKTYLAMAANGLREQRQKFLNDGALKEFDRPRRSSCKASQKKAPIADEVDRFIWAVMRFFSAQFGQPMKWADLARYWSLPGVRKHSGPPAIQAKRKRAEQIRNTITKVLGDLGLPA
jgi:hypothetical protein